MAKSLLLVLAFFAGIGCCALALIMPIALTYIVATKLGVF